jgi:hypothetical protein
MTCTEFQEALPYIIDSDATAEARAHLNSCRVCSDLVADVTHIAQSAKFLMGLRSLRREFGTKFGGGWNARKLNAIFTSSSAVEQRGPLTPALQSSPMIVPNIPGQTWLCSPEIESSI